MLRSQWLSKILRGVGFPSPLFIFYLKGVF
nr:MAG TPA: hypothetical protein [Caudoviricetes sp.]